MGRLVVTRAGRRASAAAMNGKGVVHLLEPDQRRSARTASVLLGVLPHLGVSQDAYISALYWAHTDGGWLSVLLMSRHDHAMADDPAFRKAVGVLAASGLRCSFARILNLAEECHETGTPPEWMAASEAPPEE
ncbi:hypothetical protein Scani_33710 [Streptomyces caniferus]|uniref:Uncharacterized protein n=1 Tax=Streptomyces caniferus TaxID=285557 RepID=A0A640S6K2_9ACTN|nr:hypothetical protein Scani_33710 [Streptomyces caniferus]